jgi:tetratricopeptide (TPR) repeat protein
MERKVPSFIKRIQTLKKGGKYEEAEEEIRRELERSPHDLLLQASLADLQVRRGHLTEARILAEGVLAEDPRHPQALLVLGDVFMKEHSPAEALECYRQAFNRDPSPYLTLRTARALNEAGRPEEALQELDKVLTVSPGEAAFLKEKAVVLNRMKRFDEALEVYERVQTFLPGDAFVRKEILRLRSLNRPEAQVVRELQYVAAMDSKKDDAQIHGLLAQKLKGMGQVKEAAAEYGKAAELEPGNLYFLKQQGFCFYRLKDYEETIRRLSEAFQKDPTDFMVRGALEKSYIALEKEEAFLALLEEIQREHSDYKPLFGMIRKLRKKLEARSPEEHH